MVKTCWWPGAAMAGRWHRRSMTLEKTRTLLTLEIRLK